MSTMEMERDAGPWGPREGSPWDDGVNLNVKQVTLHLRESSQVINGIKFQYAKLDGKLFSSPIHEADNGVIIEEVNLDGDDEYLSGISGFYGPVEGFDGLEGITSISFHTNKKIYGPYGKESGDGCVHFNSITASSPGKVVGFHGRHAEFPISIGVHMRYY